MKIYKKIFIFAVIFVLFTLFSSTYVFAYDEPALNDSEKIKYETFYLTSQSTNEELQDENELYVYIGYDSYIQFNNYSINVFDTINTRRTYLNSLKNQIKSEYVEFFTRIRPLLVANFTEPVVDQMYFSEYSPYIALDLYSISGLVEEEAFFNNLEEYSTLDIVRQIYIIEFVYTNETVISAPSDNEEYPFQTALADVGISNPQYDGTGVNMGIWEVGSEGFNYDNDLFEGRNIEFFETPSTYNTHADKVAQISTGKIATDCNIFYAEYEGNIVEKLDWFVNNNVDVVNMSFGIGGEYELGNIDIINEYTFMDSIIDYYYKYTRTTFVIAAGNYGIDFNNQYLVSTPANSLNAITVGASDCDGEIAAFSSHISFSDVKPNIVAPGANLTNISENYTSAINGTSFSAPIVSGIIALLMEEYPYLIGNPESVISVLQSSASKLPSQIEDYDDIAGVGIINYSRAKESASNTSSFNISGEQVIGTVVYEKNISLGSMQSIESSLFITNDPSFDSITMDGGLSNCSYYYDKLKIELYNNATNELLKTLTITENTDKLTYYNPTNDNLNLKIKIILTEAKISQSPNSIGILSYLIRNISLTDTLTMNGETDQLSKENYLSSNNELLYKINAMNFSYYTFEASSDKPIYIYLYDSEFNLLNTYSTTTASGSLIISDHLSNDVVYFKVRFESIKDFGNVNILIREETYHQISYNNDNNLLPYLHEHLNELMIHTYYINYRGAGFYKFTLEAITVNGEIITLPADSIIIKDHMDENIIEKYSVNDISALASNSDSSNNIYAYLNRNGYFYIHLCVPSNDYQILNLKVETVVSNEIDIFDNGNYDIIDEFEIEIFNNNTNGDYVESLYVNQATKYNLLVNYSGSQLDDIMFMVVKITQNSNGTVVTAGVVMESLNDDINKMINLSEGRYYIGYFGLNDNGAINVRLNRVVQDNGNITTTMITDPDYGTLHGSEVSINGGAYRGTTITEGFSRYVYFEGNNIPSTSRLDYFWYSSNESIASVTNYGTVFAKNVSTDKTVTIVAVYKYNPEIIFTKTFTIKKDTKTEPIIIDYTLNVHVDEKKQIELGNSSPYNFLQYYYWSSNDSTIATVDYYGYITGKNIGQTIIEGDYMYNERVTIRITVNVIS